VPGINGAPMSKPRSLPQHNRFFALVAAAFHQWPERGAGDNRFRPDSEDHLRAWLLCKAGHRHIATFHTDADADSVAALIPIVFLMMANKHAWSWRDGDDIKVCVAKSQSFAAMTHQEFCALSDAVEEVIRVETGLDPEALLREKAA